MKKRIERKGVLHFGKAWEGGLGMHDCFLFSGLAMDLKGCFFVGFFFCRKIMVGTSQWNQWLSSALADAGWDCMGGIDSVLSCPAADPAPRGLRADINSLGSVPAHREETNKGISALRPSLLSYRET